MGRFVDGEYVSDSSRKKNKNSSGLEMPEPLVYEEPEEQKFSKRIFNWIKDKRTRVIQSDQVEMAKEIKVVKNANEAIVWEKETVKEGPAYKLVQTTKLVKLSEFKDIVESEQAIEEELSELKVEVSTEDLTQIQSNFSEKIEQQPQPVNKPTKKLIPVSEIKDPYPPVVRRGNVIKANPYVVSSSNLIPLDMPLHFSSPVSGQNGQTMSMSGQVPENTYDADEAMRQEYLRNRNRPGYIAPIVYNLEGYENVVIYDNDKQDMASLEMPEQRNPNIMSLDEALSNVEGTPKGKKQEVNLMDEMQRVFGDAIEEN